jgi:T5SS/PEP-CTERM-associated repeat protein
MESAMATFQWTGSANNGNYSTAGNWQPAVGAPPGTNDVALIETPATPISGMGSAEILFTAGPVKLDGHFIATYGSPVNAQPLTLEPGAVLTTPMLHSPVAHYSNAATPAMRVGAGSCVVIAGGRILDNYAVALGQGTGTDATMQVEGAGALVNGANLPMSVGQDGGGTLTIADGGVVCVGNDDPLIYPWCLIIGNHVTATGTVNVYDGALLGHGQIVVGRKTKGTLTIDEKGLVVAQDMAIGWAHATATTQPTGEGVGSVYVKGDHARLIVANLLEVQHMGSGSLDVRQKGFVSAGIGILVNGVLSIEDGTVQTTALGNNATVTGSGTVIAAQGINNSGNINADGELTLIGDIDNSSSITVAMGGKLYCFGAVTDDGTITLKENSEASLEAVSGQTITFGGPNATLVLRSPRDFSATLDGFGASHRIVVDAEITHIAYSPATKVLTANDVNGVVVEFTMTGNYNPNGFQLTPGFPSVITV